MDNSQEQLQSQQPTNPTPNPVNSSHKSILVPVGLGILFVLITIGAYLLGTKQNQSVVSNQQNTVVPTAFQPSPTPIDETANWKTYDNDFYGFSLKYPNEWKLSQEQNGRVGPSQQTYQTFTSFISDNGINLNLYLEAGNPNYTDSDSYLNSASNNYTKKEIYVDNIKAIMSVTSLNTTQERGPFGEGETYYHIIASFYNKGKTYRVEIDSLKKNGNPEQLLKQILSTFQFTP